MAVCNSIWHGWLELLSRKKNCDKLLVQRGQKMSETPSSSIVG